MRRIERRYVLTKVGRGDYLLPSNDGQTFWRIVKGIDHDYDPFEVWQVWRMPRARAAWLIEHGDLRDWDEWGLAETGLRTRADAIQAALRTGGNNG